MISASDIIPGKQLGMDILGENQWFQRQISVQKSGWHGYPSGKSMISASDIGSEERLALISSRKINDFSVRYRFRKAIGMDSIDENR